MLTVNEIFHSIQGESTRAGQPCVFVRLTACDLRCSWCDTPYAFTKGARCRVDEVVAAVERYGCPLVEITGGEPLLQDDVYPLMERLLAARTYGDARDRRPSSDRPRARRVVKIVDVKCPGSGEAAKNDWANLELLAPHDEVKFVIAGSRRLRVRARRRRAATRARRRARGRPVFACSRRARSEGALGMDARRSAAGAAAAPAAQIHLAPADTRGV